ncbi:MAG: hypothetical protein R6V17_00390 [Halanaerobacter sp.]
MKLETSKQQQSAVLRENAPILIIIIIFLVAGAVAIGFWHYLEMTNSEQSVVQFENEVDGLVETVNKEAISSGESEGEEENKEKEGNKKLAVGVDPFQSSLKKVSRREEEEVNVKSANQEKDEKSTKSEDLKSQKVKKRIANKVRVLGLLGSPGKRLAIIGIENDVQIVKPGDRISSLKIKDINEKRVLIEEYGEELTYTFGGGQD